MILGHFFLALGRFLPPWIQYDVIFITVMIKINHLLFFHCKNQKDAAEKWTADMTGQVSLSRRLKALLNGTMEMDEMSLKVFIL